MADDGLYIQISGGVAKELLQGLAALRGQLDALTATTKKKGGGKELAKGLQEIGKAVTQMSKTLGKALDAAHQHLEDYRKETAATTKETGSEIAQGLATEEQAWARIAEIRRKAAGTKTEKQAALFETVKEQMKELGEDATLTKQQIQEFANQTIRMHQALEDTDALDENSQAVEQLADRMDYAKVASMMVTGEIKKTGQGFRAYSNEARKALGITERQNDALRKFDGPTVYEKKLTKLRQEERQGITESKKWADALAYLGQRFGKMDAQTEQYIPTLENLRKNINRLTTEARATGKVEIAESLQRIKPATAVLKALNGDLLVTKNRMEIVSDEGKKIFRDVSAERVKEVVSTLGLMPQKAEQIRKVAESFEYSDAEAEQFQNELRKVYTELDRVSKKDIKSLSGTELDEFEDDLKNVRAGVRKFSESIKTVEGQEGFRKIRTDLFAVNRSLKDHKQALREAAAEQKKQEKEAQRAAQTFDKIEKELRQLEQANHAAFDSEDTRKWKTDISAVESILRGLKGKIPDEEFERLRGRISEARREADKYANSMRKAAAQMDTKGQEEAMLSLAKTYGDSTNRINRYKKAVREVAEFDQRRMDQIQSKIDRLRSEGRQTAKVQQQINRLSQEYKELTQETNLSQRVQDRYKESLKGVTKNHSALNRSLNSTQREMGFFEQQLEHITRRIKQFGAFIVAAFVLRRVQMFFRRLVTELAEFDQALYNLRAIIDLTRSQMVVLGHTIEDVARSTKFSATEIAKGVQTLGQAGLSMQESMMAVQGVADLATGTLTEFKTVADLVTTTLNAFNLAATESSRIADIFANAINASKLTVDKLNTAFNYVGAAGRQVGLTLNELTGTLMTLADNGLRASTMGTGLRRMMLKMISPSTTLRTELSGLRMEVEDLNPKIVGWQKALENLTPILWNSQRQTVDMAKTVDYFGTRAAQVAAVLIRNAADGSAAIDQAIEKTYEYGSASRMAETQIEGLSLKFKNLADRAGLVLVALGDAGLTNVLGDVVDALRNFMTASEEFLTKYPLAAQFAGITSSVFLLTAAMSGLTPVALRLAKTLKALWLAQKAFMVSMTAVTAIGSAVIFTFNAFVDWHHRAAQAAGENAQKHATLANTIKDWGETLSDAFKTAEWENTVERFKDVEVAGENLSEMIEDELGYSIEQITEEGLPALQEAMDKITFEHLNEQMDSSIEQMEEIQAQMERMYRQGIDFDEVFGVGEDLAFGEGFQRKARAIFGVDWLTEAFGADKQEVLDEFGDALYNLVSSFNSLAEAGDWDFERIEKEMGKVLDDLAERFGEGSIQAQKFVEATTKLQFGSAISQMDGLAQKVENVSRELEQGMTLDQAKKQLEDYNIAWEELGSTNEEVAKALEERSKHMRSRNEELIKLYEQRLTGEKSLAEIQQYVRDEYNLSGKQMEEYTDILMKMDRGIDYVSTTSLKIFQRTIKNLAPELENQIDGLGDVQRAALFAQRDKILEAGEELKKTYKAVLGMGLDEAEDEYRGEKGEKRLAKILASNGLDARSIEDMRDAITQQQREALKEVLDDLREGSDDIEKEIIKIREKFKEAYRGFALEDAVDQLDKELERQLQGIDSYFKEMESKRKIDSMYDLQEIKNTYEEQTETAKDTSQKIINIKRDEAGKLIAWEQRLGDDMIHAKRNEVTGVLKLSAEKIEKEKQIEKNAVNLYADIAEERFARQRWALEAYQIERLNLLEQRKEKELEVEEERFSALIEQHKENSSKIEQLEKDHENNKENINKDYREHTKETVEDIKDRWEKMLEERYDKAENIKDKIIGLEEELAGFQQETEEMLSDIRRKHMSEREKYAQDEQQFAIKMEEAKRYAEQGMWKESKASSEEAVKAAQNLNRVVEENERTYINAADAQAKSSEALKEARKQELEATKNLKQSYQEEYETVKNQIKNISETVEEYRQKLISLTNEEFEVKINSIADTTELQYLREELQSLFDDYDGKTIHIDVKKDVDSEEGKKTGGLISLIVDKAKKFARGGSLGGYGGGDVVDAKLEPGEYVIRKEAVRAYGSQLFDMLNQMKFDSSSMFGAIKARMGRMIPEIPKITPAYQTGGSISNVPNFGSLNLTIDNTEVGQIYAEPDVLKKLNEQITRRKRLRSND